MIFWVPEQLVKKQVMLYVMLLLQLQRFFFQGQICLARHYVVTETESYNITYNSLLFWWQPE